ncbi:MAG: molybdenum cofactor biosynthesis protein MoaE [Parvularculaceae bacterium]|nr:molybdenum cofactor biosynthesis protein MoaE [Amphiplicatus sp.]HRX38777.1 molybdenum cofactor biosynthesis protein MoaE [Parvularculaceae bacterium]
MMQKNVSIEMASAPFDPHTALRAFTERFPEAGAIASFIGQVRGERGEVDALILDHYAGVTESEIAKIAEEALSRWPLFGLAITHRVGEIAPGEPIVFVAAASKGRRAAFQAVDFLMDYLKSEAPFWKKESRGGQTQWIEPRAEDFEDKARWNAQEE